MSPPSAITSPPQLSSPFLHRLNTSPPSLSAAVPRRPPSSASPSDDVARYHAHSPGPNQCCSAIVQEIRAPIDTVWSVVRRFDAPHIYKHFLKSCHVISGDGDVGTLRRVCVSDERLEILDDCRRVISFFVVGGDHRLSNYRSVTSLHSGKDDRSTAVVESYVVDIPAGNTKEETCLFVDTIVRCNLQSLAQIAENLARGERREEELINS